MKMLRRERMITSRLCRSAVIAATTALLFAAPASAQQGPPDGRLEQILVCQDAVKQGKIDTNMLNQMSAMVAAQGYSLTNKVLQLCNGWLMETKRADGSPGIVYVEPKTKTIVDVDFR
jgi:hypothetical protein